MTVRWHLSGWKAPPMSPLPPPSLFCLNWCAQPSIHISELSAGCSKNTITLILFRKFLKEIKKQCCFTAEWYLIFVAKINNRRSVVYAMSTCTKSSPSSSTGSVKLTFFICFSSSCVFRKAFSLSSAAIRAWTASCASFVTSPPTEEIQQLRL